MVKKIKRLLIVDDQFSTKYFYIDKIFEKKDIKVIIAKDDFETIKALCQKENKIDGIILDMGIPYNGIYDEKGGEKLLEDIRRIDNQIPILIFSTTMCSKLKKYKVMGQVTNYFTVNGRNVFDGFLDLIEKGQ